MRYREGLETCGMEVTGISPDGKLVEIVELRDHPWFLGCQFHPEFKSKPFNPHPLFREFIKASLKYRQDKAKCRKK
jgi:CTP synthase